MFKKLVYFKFLTHTYTHTLQLTGLTHGDVQRPRQSLINPSIMLAENRIQNGASYVKPSLTWLVLSVVDMSHS